MYNTLDRRASGGVGRGGHPGVGDVAVVGPGCSEVVANHVAAAAAPAAHHPVADWSPARGEAWPWDG